MPEHDHNQNTETTLQTASVQNNIEYDGTIRNRHLLPIMNPTLSTTVARPDNQYPLQP